MIIKSIIAGCIFIFTTLVVVGQIRQPVLPKVRTFSPITLPSNHPQSHQRTRPIPQPNTNSPLLNPQRQLNHAQLQEQIRRDSRPRNIQYELPSLAHLEGTEHYRQAYRKISAMLDNQQPISLKDAVFLVENAYLDNRLTIEWYHKQVNTAVDFIKVALKEKGYKTENETAKKLLLHQFMSDTIELKKRRKKQQLPKRSLPKTYDFEDIYGKQDWSKMFVTKLMTSNQGQCHSLPLYYLILAEALDVEAHLAFSPQHSYIKLQDERGVWYNLELTNGYHSTDAWMFGSGYLKVEAISSGIYMTPLTKKQTIAACLVDLVQGYIRKYGYDSFVYQCIRKALFHDPKNIFALQLEFNYQLMRFYHVAVQLGQPPLQELPNYPDAYQMFQYCGKLQQNIKALGFEEMPEHAYEAWLKSLEHQKQFQTEFPRP